MLGLQGFNPLYFVSVHTEETVPICHNDLEVNLLVILTVRSCVVRDRTVKLLGVLEVPVHVLTVYRVTR